MTDKKEIVITYTANKYLTPQNKRVIKSLYKIVAPYLDYQEILDVEGFDELEAHCLFPTHYEEYLIFKKDNDLEMSRICSKDIMALFLARLLNIPVLVLDKVERKVCDELGIRTTTLEEMREQATLFSEKNIIKGLYI